MRLLACWIFGEIRGAFISMKKLYRNNTASKIAGVCSGIGDYFDIDPVLIRLIFLFGFFLGGGLIVYIIGWIVIPLKN